MNSPMRPPRGPLADLVSTTCPRCGQEAPVVMRGLKAFCTVCGAPRTPLGSMPVNVAGQPSKVGGTIAFAFGWLVLVIGLHIAFLVGSVLQAIFAGGIVGWIFGVPIGA